MQSILVPRLVVTGPLSLLFASILWIGPGLGSEARTAIVAGGAFDAAPFGEARYDAANRTYEVQWGEPRKIRRIEVAFARESHLPAIDKVRVQYWHRVWDGKPDPVLPETGACRAGTP